MINPLFLMLQSISGGVAGYITNKYAVNMLFKEYTPLKLGGVVKKNKEKFIDEISTLVEKDIINGKTLKEHIHGEEFKKQLNITVEEFWNSALKEIFNDVKIKDISSFEESKQSILEFTESKMKLVSDKLLKNIVDNVKITEILSAKHISYITNIVYEEVFKYIKSEHKISVLLTDIYHQNNSLIIKDIIDEATETKIKTNIEEFIINSLEKILTDKEKLSNMMGKIYDVINIDEIKTRLFGNKMYVDVEISVDGNLTLNEAHDIAQNVHDAIESKFEHVKHCMVHVNPDTTNMTCHKKISQSAM